MVFCSVYVIWWKTFWTPLIGDRQTVEQEHAVHQLVGLLQMQHYREYLLLRLYRNCEPTATASHSTSASSRATASTSPFDLNIMICRFPPHATSWRLSLRFGSED